MSWTDYKRLLDNCDTDPAAWRAAARANPNDPRTACKLAVEQAEPWEVASVLLLLARQAESLALYELLSEAARALVSLPERDRLSAVEHLAGELVGLGVDAGLTLGELRALGVRFQNDLTEAILQEVER